MQNGIIILREQIKIIELLQSLIQSSENQGSVLYGGRRGQVLVVLYPTENEYKLIIGLCVYVRDIFEFIY